MTLDHELGDMTGEILKAPWQGARAGGIWRDEFIGLLQYCRNPKDETLPRL